MIGVWFWSGALNRTSAAPTFRGSPTPAAPTHAHPRADEFAFVSSDDGDDEIYVMNGDAVVQLTQNDADDNFPAWSSDGTRIAFASERHGNAEIYVMQADGSQPTRLTNHESRDSAPVWSTDGTQLAFWTNRDSGGELYVINADGSDPHNITNSPDSDESEPSWRPAPR